MKENLLALARPEILDLIPYSSARSEKLNGEILLNANENPFFFEINWNRYPEQQPLQLAQALAKLYGVNTENLLITRGSDEAIDLLLRCFCQANKEGIVICPPTYGMYEIAAKIQGASTVAIPLIKNKGFTINAAEINRQWDLSRKIIFLCSPNNPTGNLLEPDVILQLCKDFLGKAIIVVDEAYIEFAETNSLSQFQTQNPNLVILRTLSKSFGLAGVRCGVLLANEFIIRLLKKILAPYPIASPVIEIIMSRLTTTNKNIVSKHIESIKQERERLRKFLMNLSTVSHVWSSEANFLLVEVKDKAGWLKKCLANGIIVRDRSQEFNLENCIRISIGTPEENQKLCEVLNG